MGKGTIISGGTDGLYNIQVNLNRAGITKMITKLNENIASFTRQVETLTADIAELLAAIESLQSQIETYQSINPAQYQKEIEAALKTQTLKIDICNTLKQNKSILVLKIQAARARIAYLNSNMPADPVLPAWCADLTEDLTGEVATIEVPGERGTVLVCPGAYSDYDAEIDGQLNPSINQTPEQCYWNLAMLPGWQKWLPTYRFGWITAIDYNADTCDVTLENIKSSQENLSINQVTHLVDVPIEYMTCNAGAFSVNDYVVVQCTNTITDATADPPVKASISTTYKVIGFKDHPRPCDALAVFSMSSTTGKASIVVWDCRNNELVLGPVDFASEEFTAWLEEHKVIGNALFASTGPDVYPPYHWHPELTDDGYYHQYHYDGGFGATFWRWVINKDPADEITGLRTEFEESISTEGWSMFIILFHDAPEVRYNFIYGTMGQPERYDYVKGLYPDGYYWEELGTFNVYSGTKKYTFHGPYGIVDVFEGTYSGNTTGIDYATERKHEIIRGASPFRFSASQDGRFNGSSFAVATLIQYQPRDYYKYEADPIIEEESYGDRIIKIQAQAGVISKDETWLSKGNNAALESELIAMVELFYILNPSFAGITGWINVVLVSP